MGRPPSRVRRIWTASLRETGVLLLAAVLTGLLFLVLPLLERVNQAGRRDVDVRAVQTVDLPPPPPPPEEPEPEEEEEPPPPELAEESPPMDLSQLELALNPGGGGGLGDAMAGLSKIVTQLPSDSEMIFSAADLDQAPRAVYQPAPEYPRAVRSQNLAGTVYVLFIVDKNGRVEKPRVQKSTNPVFEPAALQAVRRWRFDPGKRKGKPVQFRMRVPISFAGQ